MRYLRRNVLGVYAVYAVAVVSGLVVTPIVIHSVGTEGFGVWSFIGSVTIYLSVLDGEYGTAGALSTILIAVTATAVYAALRLSGNEARALI